MERIIIWAFSERMCTILNRNEEVAALPGHSFRMSLGEGRERGEGGGSQPMPACLVSVCMPRNEGKKRKKKEKKKKDLTQ